MADAREQRATALPSGAAAGPTPQDWKDRALALFSVEGQYPLSWIVKFKGEFLDEFAEEDAAHGFVEDWARRMADFVESWRAGVAAKVETAPPPDYAAMQAEIEAFDVEDAWRTSAEWMERLMAIIKKYVGEARHGQ